MSALLLCTVFRVNAHLNSTCRWLETREKITIAHLSRSFSQAIMEVLDHIEGLLGTHDMDDPQWDPFAESAAIAAAEQEAMVANPMWTSQDEPVNAATDRAAASLPDLGGGMELLSVASGGGDVDSLLAAMRSVAPQKAKAIPV
eukprot:SAG11_NODE_9060_length_948_cov_1.151943_1_plen_144_part_00